MAPSLAILFPAYNGSQYIAEAIESILTQRFANFELLVINDASTDKTLTILEQLATHDARVGVVWRENRGLIATLDQGLLLSKMDIIARMDADDVGLSHQLECKVAFMKAHLNVNVCGVEIVFYETGGERLRAERDAELQMLALFSTPFFHPKVIICKSRILAVGGYSSDALCAEEFDLWERRLHTGCKFVNLGGSSAAEQTAS